MFYSDLQAHVWHKHMHASKTLMHVKKVNIFLKVILKVFEKHLNKGPPSLLDQIMNQIKSILMALTVVRLF